MSFRLQVCKEHLSSILQIREIANHATKAVRSECALVLDQIRTAQHARVAFRYLFLEILAMLSAFLIVLKMNSSPIHRTSQDLFVLLVSRTVKHVSILGLEDA